jgi:phage I-like protein
LREQLAVAKAELEKEQMTRLSAQFNGALDKAVTEGRIAPVERQLWEGYAKDDGYEKSITRLSAYVSVVGPRVSATGATQKAVSGFVSQESLAVGRKLGFTAVQEADYQKWLSEKADR